MLRLAPAAFWSMTPRELALGLRGAAGLGGSATALARTDLAALMRRFPDDPPTR
jgi:uncharacterized phage protein (TIGR02216 family)